jgi:hypothetical protein
VHIGGNLLHALEERRVTDRRFCILLGAVACGL